MRPWKSFNIGRYNEHYNGHYNDSDMEWRRLTGQGKAAHIYDVLGDHAAEVESVLDVGCGTGIVIYELAQLGVGQKFLGVDLADPHEHEAPEVRALAGVALQAYDGITLPVADNSFDLVFASHVLEHVPNERPFLAELARVAKRFVCVEVPCELNVQTSRDRIQQTLDIGHMNSYTPESFMLTLETSGLRVLSWELFDISAEARGLKAGGLLSYGKYLIKRAILRINPLLAAKLFTYHCCALCEPAPPPFIER